MNHNVDSPDAPAAAAAELRISKSGGVARIVVCNPLRRNALTLALQRQLTEAFQALDRDPATRCIVLTGDGTQSFISGADISEFEQHSSDPASRAEYLRAGTATILAPARNSKPVIASIRGACIGGGLQLAVSCDIRIAARDAFFVMPAARLGVGYPYAGLSLFVSLLGRGRTADLFMSGRRIPAEEALRIGLVDRVVPEEELDEEVASYAAGVAGNAPLTLALVKESIRTLTDPLADSTPPLIQRMVEHCAASEDAVEGRTAFLEKRRPSFHGR